MGGTCLRKCNKQSWGEVFAKKKFKKHQPVILTSSHKHVANSGILDLYVPIWQQRHVQAKSFYLAVKREQQQQKKAEVSDKNHYTTITDFCAVLKYLTIRQ